MGYSDEEKKAIDMTERYYYMIKGVKLGGDIPSQDRGEMYRHLHAHKRNSQLIDSLFESVEDFDLLRSESCELNSKVNINHFRLLKLWGKPQFS